MVSRILLFSLLAFALAACGTAEQEKSNEVTVIVDGRRETFSFTREITVDQLLAGAQIELNQEDRISHPLVSQISDGMLLTIRRVHSEQVCQQQDIAYQRRIVPNEGVPAGQEQLGQTGRPGLQEACYRVVYEDDVEEERIPIDQPISVREPVDEIIYTGPTEKPEPLEFSGQIAYINHGNPWTINGNTVNKRPLATMHRLDSLVFSLSEDGNRLMYTAETIETDEFFNELWMIATDDDVEPQRLTPTDVLYADWRPRTRNTIAYSTGERREGTPGWNALNNLWLMNIDLESGRTLTIEEALPESAGGLYGWWGTDFSWSPYGDSMAWSRADGFGLVDFELKQLTTLVDYAVFHSPSTWVWLSSLSWSHDNELIASIVHGSPIGDEQAETSPVFDVAISAADGRFSAPLSFGAGMWAAPSFSPNTSRLGSEYSDGYLAWLQAREPHNSISGEYELILADRDGSNRRALYPPPRAEGIRKSDFGLTPTDIAWSPDARFMALIYQGDLWLVEVESAVARQLTFDGGSSNPVWTR